MEFSLPPEYAEIRTKYRHFAETELSDDVVLRDVESQFPRNLWDKCAEAGVQGLAAPKAFGGGQEVVDVLATVFAMEGLGYGCKDNGLLLGLNAQMWTVQMVIADFGTEAQQEKFLRPLAEGKWIGAHALTEADAGSDVYSLKTKAEKVEGGYLLNGKKHLVTFAPIADLVLVFASTNPKYGKWGLSAFLLETDRDGCHLGANQSKMGLRTAPFGQIELQDCFIPEENRLGKEGAGFSLCNHSLEYDRCGILASNLGTMERQLDEAIEFVKQRRQFGKSIAEFQSVSNRIANMKLRLETSRLLMYKVAWSKQRGEPAILESSLLKLHLSESFVASSLDAIRIHGGVGYLSEYEVERNLRDAMGGTIYAGTSDIQRNIIAKMMGL